MNSCVISVPAREVFTSFRDINVSKIGESYDEFA